MFLLSKKRLRFMFPVSGARNNFLPRTVPGDPRVWRWRWRGNRDYTTTCWVRAHTGTYGGGIGGQWAVSLSRLRTVRGSRRSDGATGLTRSGYSTHYRGQYRG